MSGKVIGYEAVLDLSLPPLGEMYGIDGGLYWDAHANHPVDYDKLVRAGYYRPIIDTLPQWLAWRFGELLPDTEWPPAMRDGEVAYWEHEAAAVRRAVARGGFKPKEEA